MYNGLNFHASRHKFSSGLHAGIEPTSSKATLRRSNIKLITLAKHWQKVAKSGVENIEK